MKISLSDVHPVWKGNYWLYEGEKYRSLRQLKSTEKFKDNMKNSLQFKRLIARKFLYGDIHF